MPKFREVPPTNQSLYPTKRNTKEALEHARMLLPEANINTFMQAMLVYHNSLLAQLEAQQ